MNNSVTDAIDFVGKGLSSAERGTSSKRRKKKFAGLRQKESKRIPVREIEEPPRLSDVSHVKYEIVDVQELQHRVKMRAKRLRCLSDWLCWISITVALVCTVVTAIEYYSVQLEHMVENAIAQQTASEWKPICSTQIIQRQVFPNVYEQTDCIQPTISDAPWSPWSECINGRKHRWRIMKKEVRYLMEDTVHEENTC